MTWCSSTESLQNVHGKHIIENCVHVVKTCLQQNNCLYFIFMNILKYSHTLCYLARLILLKQLMNYYKLPEWKNSENIKLAALSVFVSMYKFQDRFISVLVKLRRWDSEWIFMVNFHCESSKFTPLSLNIKTSPCFKW